MNGNLPGRGIDWPDCLSNGTDLVNLAVDIAAEIETLARGSDTLLVLVECGDAGREEMLSLAALVSEQWSRSGLRGLVVDAHPARPFLPREEPQPEGFTEILHYGLSPGRVAERRTDFPGEWIPAGGAWTLPLENPAEPERTLGRFARHAQRVLILADAEDAEGFLECFRSACSYRLDLASGPARASATAAPRARRSPPRAAVLLLLLLLPLVAGGWWLQARQAGGGSPPAGEVESRFIPLPAPVPLPYGGGESDAGPRVAVEQAESGNPEPRAPQASPSAVRRRFESRDSWRSLLDRRAGYLVHVESYRDSTLGDRTARERGYGAMGYSLRRTDLDGEIWFRLCVGPFDALPTAAACRDSLLDATAVEYCVITPAADPSARR